MLNKKSIKQANTGIKKAILGIQVSTIALLTITCANSTPTSDTTTANPTINSTVNSSPVSASNETLIFVSIPASKKSTQEQALTVMTNYLQKQLKRNVQLQLVKDYDSAIEMLVTGKAQIGFLGPLAYIKAKARNPKIELIAASIYEETKRPWYTSLIITVPQTNIKTLNDLKGKKFGFVSKSSTSGFLVPSVAFKKAKISPEKDFSEIIYSGNHDQAITDLMAGKVDAVAIEESAIAKAKKTGLLTDTNYLKIWESDPIPSSPIVINEKFPAELVTNLKSAIINSQELTNDSGVKASGYTTITDQDYDSIREVEKELGLAVK